MDSEKNNVHNMASCMLSILDSIKLYDKGALDLSSETLSEVMFRKMKGYGIDLNEELGFTHLGPVSTKERNDILSEREDLILKVLNNGKESLEKTQKDHKEMISEYEKNGFGDMHPGNIEGYKLGLNYTLGYTFGHLELLKKVNSLMKMDINEINELIKSNENIEKENREYMKKILKDIKKRNGK